MDALGKYGIINDQLDKVSNYYRYQRSKGEMWPTNPAVAYALGKDGKIIGYEIENAAATAPRQPSTCLASKTPKPKPNFLSGKI